MNSTPVHAGCHAECRGDPQVENMLLFQFCQHRLSLQSMHNIFKLHKYIAYNLISVDGKHAKYIYTIHQTSIHICIWVRFSFPLMLYNCHCLITLRLTSVKRRRLFAQMSLQYLQINDIPLSMVFKWLIKKFLDLS